MNQLKLFLILIIPTLILFQSCTKGPESGKAKEMNMDSVRAQIDVLEDAYVKANNAKDVEGVAAYFAPDAQSLANNEPTWVGMDEIKAGIRRDIANADSIGYTVAFTTTGLWAAGNYATETGTIKEIGKDGKTIGTGKYMTLFELRNGKYIAIRDIWNEDAPEGQ